jgi:hypothetical protein
MVVSQCHLHHAQIRPQFPAVVFPETHPGGMPGEDEDVALVDIRRAQFRQTGCHQPKPNPLPAPPLGHGKMMQITTPPIVSAQDRADDLALFHRNKTQPRIAA